MFIKQSKPEGSVFIAHFNVICVCVTCDNIIMCTFEYKNLKYVVFSRSFSPLTIADL